MRISPCPRPRRAIRVGVLFAVAAVLLTSLAPTPATAAARADDIRWTVVPSSPTGPKGRKQFDYELSPREAITDWISVRNLGNKPLTVDLYPTDAFTAQDGGFALLPREQLPADVGTWITLPKKQVTLPVGMRADIPFQLKVPAGAAPGDHPGGVIASVTEQQVNASGQRVDVERRIASRVYLRVAGPLRPAADITAVDIRYANPLVPFGGSDATVTYRIANHGNVRLTGKARVQVSGPLGVRLANSDVVDLPELLPDSEIRLTKKVPGVFPAGRLTAVVSVNPETTAGSLPAVTGSASLWAVPWMVVAFVVVLVGVLVVWWLRRRAAGRDDEAAAVLLPKGRAGGAVPTATR